MAGIAPARDLRSKVLVLEDDESLALALQQYLEQTDWKVQTAATAKEARRQLGETDFDLVLADYLLPDENGLSVLDEVARRSPSTKVMVMTGVKDMEVAVQAFKRGAADLITKPFRLPHLTERIDLLMKERQVQVPSRPQASTADPFHPLSHMVGESLAMKKVFRLIHLVADKNITVMITGESGTGKELVARAIHDESGRDPFVAINCSAIPEHLLEDELFGHVKGAYTDARQTRAGKFEQASGGTIFLDEIGEMPLMLQVKLLRVLEEREFQKLGSNQNVQVDVRILAATNGNLEQRVKEGTFRADLFFRLNVVPIHLRPLREKKEDIPIIVDFLLDTISRTPGFPRKEISPEALDGLMSYSFPGNVRELRNVLELASVLSEDNPVLKEGDFPSLSNASAFIPGEPTSAPSMELPEEGVDLNQVVSSIERNLICQSLHRSGGNKGKAARLLHLKRTTLVEKLRRMNLLEEFSR